MMHAKKWGLLSLAALALCGTVSAASAAGITRTEIVLPKNMPPMSIPIAATVTVPPGYTTYYISGAGGPGADTEAQTAATLARLKTTLAKLGLTFGDVVAAHVYLVGDPAKGGKMDFAGMNKAWGKEFGTKAQPNKPARAAVQVAGLAMKGGLVEIEFIAAKKVK